MRQTTLRFGEDVWRELEREAKRNGVSAAQYVRDATLARLAYTAGLRGDPPFGSGRDGARGPGPAESSAAVWAQAHVARERAQAVRRDAQAFQQRTSRDT
jgi:hypothetical protein